MIRRLTLFADAEPGEYFPEQVIRQHLPRNQAKAVVRKAQLLGKQIKYTIVLAGMLHGMRKMEAGLFQCVDVSLPGKPWGFAARIPASELQQPIAQLIQA